MNISKIFSNGMVIQAEKPINIFGKGCGTVSAEIDGLKAEINSKDDCWCLTLPPHTYGGPYTLNVILNGEELSFEDVWFGDVSLVTGQSNNQLKLWQTNTPKELYTDNENLRLFSVDRLEDQGKHVLTDNGWVSVTNEGAVVDLQGEHYSSDDGWVTATKDTDCFWSALGYLVGKSLQEETGRKIGLVACYQGGSVIQSWLPKDYLLNTNCYIPDENRSHGYKNAAYFWNKDGFLYENMLEHIIPFGFKCVLWYQGESNASGEDINKYGDILKLLINKWREDFKDKDLPFIVVGLHDYEINMKKDNGSWLKLQTEQERACKETKGAFLIRCADVCEKNTIHPPTKTLLADRIFEAIKTNIL